VRRGRQPLVGPEASRPKPSGRCPAAGSPGRRCASRTFSPKAVGSFETRISKSRPWWPTLMRPSCGRRRSAMPPVQGGGCAQGRSFATTRSCRRHEEQPWGGWMRHAPTTTRRPRCSHRRRLQGCAQPPRAQVPAIEPARSSRAARWLGLPAIEDKRPDPWWTYTLVEPERNGAVDELYRAVPTETHDERPALTPHRIPCACASPFRSGTRVRAVSGATNRPPHPNRRLSPRSPGPFCHAARLRFLPRGCGLPKGPAGRDGRARAPFQLCN